MVARRPAAWSDKPPCRKKRALQPSRLVANLEPVNAHRMPLPMPDHPRRNSRGQDDVRNRRSGNKPVAALAWALLGVSLPPRGHSAP